METEGPKEKETQQMNGLGQKEESGDAKSDIHEEKEEGKGETPGDGKEVHEASEAQKTETAEKESKGEVESTGKGLGAEEVQEMKTREKEKETGEPEQAEAEDKVSLGVSGTEPKEEADASESAKGVQEGGGDTDAPERSTSVSSKEGRTGSTSDEPLSPEPEEEEEYWPEFAPSSPESPQSPTASKSLETGGTISGPAASEATTEDTASTEAGPKGDENQQPAPEATPEAKEKKKRPAFDRREITRPRMPPRAQSRKAIMEKFGGAATGPAPNIKKTGGANTVKTMLLEWCRAKTRGYEHVDVQNFSSSWSSGMAFCALIHKFFPDAFDYSALDPANRRENFTLAFSTAENLADCPQLLEVDDMVRMKVPDNKCIYTYIQELYRSLVEKGLVKTKKK